MILSAENRSRSFRKKRFLAIRRAVNGNYRVEPHPFLKCGERVRVTRGSLEGVEGILVRKKNLFRLVLSVDMLAQSVGRGSRCFRCGTGGSGRQQECVFHDNRPPELQKSRRIFLPLSPFTMQD